MGDIEFTHLAKIYGFKCYYNEYTNEIQGTNWFNDKAIEFFVWVDTTFEINEGFVVEIIEEL